MPVHRPEWKPDINRDEKIPSGALGPSVFDFFSTNKLQSSIWKRLHSYSAGRLRTQLTRHFFSLAPSLLPVSPVSEEHWGADTARAAIRNQVNILYLPQSKVDWRLSDWNDEMIGGSCGGVRIYMDSDYHHLYSPKPILHVRLYFVAMRTLMRQSMMWFTQEMKLKHGVMF